MAMWEQWGEQMGRLYRDHRVDSTKLELVDCPTAEKDRCHDMSYIKKFMSGLDAMHNRKISCQSLDHISRHKQAVNGIKCGESALFSTPSGKQMRIPLLACITAVSRG
jgi:hypothetical protein